jgi:hypothetical protein
MNNRRVSVTVDEETWDILYRLLPWGSRSACLRALLELFADGVKEHGLIMLGAVQAKEVRLVLRSNIEQHSPNLTEGEKHVG